MHLKLRSIPRILTTFCLISLAVTPPVKAHDADENVKVNAILQKELATHPGEQVSMTVVTYPAGTASKPHQHHGPVFVYVLEGTVELQITGGPLTTVHAGETFYEPPGAVHAVSRNASDKEPAKLLAFIIGKIGTPVTSAVPEAAK